MSAAERDQPYLGSVPTQSRLEQMATMLRVEPTDFHRRTPKHTSHASIQLSQAQQAKVGTAPNYLDRRRFCFDGPAVIPQEVVPFGAARLIGGA